MTPGFWRGRRVFLTGHTGFKGSWLSLWLQRLGADVTGYALEPPTTPSLFALANVGKGMRSVIADVGDLPRLKQELSTARPEVVVHMAAQPLVHAGYDEAAFELASQSDQPLDQNRTRKRARHA